MTAALSSFTKYVAPEVPGCPEPLIEDAVLRACIEFCERTEVLREEFTASTIASQDYLTMTPAGGDVVKVDDAVINGDPLERTRRQDYDTDAGVGPPREYYVERPNTLRFMPVPDAIYTVTINAAVKPTRAATAVDDLLFNTYRDAIAQGAKAFLMSMVNVPWANGDGATLNAGLFSDAAGKARYHKATGGTSAPLRARGHYF